MSIALFIFFFYHLWLIRSGFTTNEKIKRSYTFDKINYGVKKREEIISKLKKEKPELWEENVKK